MAKKGVPKRDGSGKGTRPIVAEAVKPPPRKLVRAGGVKVNKEMSRAEGCTEVALSDLKGDE